MGNCWYSLLVSLSHTQTYAHTYPLPPCCKQEVKEPTSFSHSLLVQRKWDSCGFSADAKCTWSVSSEHFLPHVLKQFYLACSLCTETERRIKLKSNVKNSNVLVSCYDHKSCTTGLFNTVTYAWVLIVHLDALFLLGEAGIWWATEEIYKFNVRWKKEEAITLFLKHINMILAGSPRNELNLHIITQMLSGSDALKGILVITSTFPIV